MANFGWGRNLKDKKAREGTFYVNPGNGGVLGIEPSCNAGAPTGEAGGHVMGTAQAYNEDNYSGPAQAYKYKLNKDDMGGLTGGVNDLVKEELGEVGYYRGRGDPCLFHYPDGNAGAFIERTRCFYKLAEIAVP